MRVVTKISYSKEETEKMSKQKKHDDIVQDLEDRLNNSKFFGKNFYNSVQPNVYFNTNKRGECDCLAIKKYSDGRKVLLLFEVKQTKTDKSQTKAVKQLRKDIDRFYSEDFYRVFTFFVYGDKTQEEGYSIKRKRLRYKKRKDKTERFSKE